MEYIAKNDELLSRSFKEGYYILDAEITRFDIYQEDYTLYIDVYFSLSCDRFKTDRKLKLHFIGVTEYRFSWSSPYAFYTVERYKFFKSKKGYYLSVDPYNEAETVLEEDSDIIFSEEVEGYFL